MSFADNLKKARLDRGMTQIEIANQLGVDKSTYSGYESGKRQPDVKRIKEIASILNVSADTLIGTHYTVLPAFLPSSPSARFIEAIDNRPEIEELLRLAVNCSTDDVWKMIDIWRIVQRPGSKK